MSEAQGIRYAAPDGETRQQMRDWLFTHSDGQELYKHGDCVLVWANEGDLLSATMQQAQHRAELEAVREACADKVWSVLADYIEEQPRDGISAEGAVSDQLKAEQRAFVKGLRIARFKARRALDLDEILKEARKD